MIIGEGYLQIRKEYLDKAWARPARELEACLPARFQDDAFRFQAFGETCQLHRENILLSGKEATGPEGLLIALYASRVPPDDVQFHPLHSFKELPNSMPYHAAFSAHAERVLIPHVPSIRRAQEKILAAFSGHPNTDAPTGDFSFTLYPLPKVPLYWIFHLPDEEFPASVTCLFATNAAEMMPVDGLADVAEMTAKRVISLVGRLGR